MSPKTIPHTTSQCALLDTDGLFLAVALLHMRVTLAAMMRCSESRYALGSSIR